MIAGDDEIRVSQIWKAVVHPFCAHIRTMRPPQQMLAKGICSFYPACPMPVARSSGMSCMCPSAAAANRVVLARRLGRPTVQIPTSPNSAAQRAAQRAGLGQDYQRVPLRENPSFDNMRKHGVLVDGVDDSIWNEPSNWHAPPPFLNVDVNRTIHEGRIIAWTEPAATDANPS
jgi:hypothetical protein